MDTAEPHQKKKMIWTIGHSTCSIDEFVAMLKSFQITLVADIRRFPGSKKYPHFNQDDLRISLGENDIEYIHFEALGGRRGWKVNHIMGVGKETEHPYTGPAKIRENRLSYEKE